MLTNGDIDNKKTTKSFDALFVETVNGAAAVSLRSYETSHHKQRISQIFSSHFLRNLLYSRSYAFMFRKNSSITNIQHAELFALLSDGIKRSEALAGDLVFHSSREFRNDLELLWCSLVCVSKEFQEYCDEVDRRGIGNKIDAKINKLTKAAIKKIVSIYDAAYREQCSRTVLIDPFFGSCCIGMPKHLELDLPFVVGQSGYIDSAGELVYCRNFAKASPKELLSKLRDAHEAILESFTPKATGLKVAPIKFCIYSHESFDKFESDFDLEGIQDGLDNIKIYSHKNFIGSMLVSDLVGTIQNLKRGDSPRFSIIGEHPGMNGSSLEVTDNHIALYNQRYKEQYKPPCTIFLVKDQSIASDGGAGKDYFYICYAQLFKNENPFYAFEEDKPAWLSMVTTPHSLASAMINIGRKSSSSSNGHLNIWDPFCSTGTIPFEISKLGNDVSVVASDILKSAKFVIKDNLKIFSSCSLGQNQSHSNNERCDIIERNNEFFSFDSLIDHLKSIKLDNSFVPLSSNEKFPAATAPVRVIVDWAYHRVRNIVNKYVSDRLFIPDEEGIDLQLHASLRTLRDVDLLAQSEFNFIVGKEFAKYWLHRIVLYIIWRAALTNIHEFIDADTSIASRLIRVELNKKIIKLEKLRRLHLACNSSAGLHPTRLDNLDCFSGTFSDIVTLTPHKLASWWNDERVSLITGEEGDVQRVGRKYKNYFDLIITDPPYGFNTDVKSGEEQLDFYRGLISVLLTSIKHRGQLIFCLPDESVNGQMVPSYLRKPWVLRELFIQVSVLFEHGRIIEFSSTKPKHGTLLFKPPYYWRSKKSLTRSILHLIVEKPECAGPLETEQNHAPHEAEKIPLQD